VPSSEVANGTEIQSAFGARHTQLKNTKSIKGQLIPVSYKTPAVLLIIKSRKSIVGYRIRKIQMTTNMCPLAKWQPSLLLSDLSMDL
jgi:hypothetical protein